MSKPGDAPTADNGAAEPVRPRKRRWIRRLLFGVVAFGVLTVATLQIILQTDLPRRIVLARLQAELGLRIDAASLSTGWFGRTTLRDVTVGLPLAEDAFLHTPVLNVNHTSLPVLLIRRSLDIHVIELVRPRLIVRQDAQGGWNVQEAVALARRSAGSRDDRLPRVSISDAAVTLIDRAGQTADLAPVQVSGRPDDALTWSFEATVSSQVRIEGRVAPGQRWNHQVAFSIDEPDRLLAPWLVDWPGPMQFQGEWRGQVAGPILTGRLDLQNAKVRTVDLSGTLDVEASGGSAVVAPRTLVARINGGSAVAVRVSDGSIQVRDSRVSAEDLRVHLLGGSVRVQGQFDWALNTARLEAEWIDLALPPDVRHRGRLTATLQTPWADRPQIEVDLHTAGVTPHGQWDGRLALSGQGQSWSSFDWRLSLPQAQWTGKPSDIAVQDIVARLTSDNKMLRLVAVRWKDTDQLAGTGQYDFDCHGWELALKAHGVALPRVPSAADITIGAAGDRRQISVSELRLQTASLTALVKGSYDLVKSRRFEADLALWQNPPAADQPRTVEGVVLRGDAHASGTFQPLRADLTAQLFGRDVYIGKHQLGDLTIQLAGSLDNTGANLKSKEVDLLDGHWTLRGRYGFEDGSAAMAVVVRDLPLKQADALIDPPPRITGSLGAEVRIDMPGGDGSRLKISGEWLVKDFGKDAVRAERVLGRVSLEDQVLVLDEIQMHQKDGRGSARIRYDLRQRDQLAVMADLKDWPIQHPTRPLAVKVSGNTSVKIDLAGKSATGPLKLNADVQLKEEAFARLSLSSVFQGRELEVPALRADLLEGSVEGQAHLALDDLLKSTAKVNWRDVDGAALANLVPALQGLEGRFSGSLDAAKPLDPRATAPLSVRAHLQSADAKYKAMDIGDARIVALMDRIGREQSPLPDRIVIDRSVFAVGGGQVKLWARAGSQLGLPLEFVHAQIEFGGLDLDQLVHVLEPKAKPMVGRLAGELTLFGPRRDVKLLRGDATVRLTRSDLANSDVISAFYRAFSLRPGPMEPIGSGTARVRLEDGGVQIPNLSYQTRGLDMRASGQVENILLGLESPISGYAFGSARPLRDVKLPFMAELDEAFGALQANVTPLRITGTLGDHDARPAAFSELSDSLRQWIIGEVGRGDR